jgi:hypothetical protein
MLRAPFIVVADRGVVKAYELRQTAKHGTAARLVMERKLGEAHERYRDKVTDQAGAFPSTGTRRPRQRHRRASRNQFGDSTIYSSRRAKDSRAEPQT